MSIKNSYFKGLNLLNSIVQFGANGVKWIATATGFSAKLEDESTLATVAGADAVGDNDFVTLQQLNTTVDNILPLQQMVASDVSLDEEVSVTGTTILSVSQLNYNNEITMLLSSNTTDGDPTFTDTSISANHDFTKVGTPYHSDSQSVLGLPTSIYFNGSSNLTFNHHVDNYFPAGTNFVIDFWFYVSTAQSNKGLFSLGGSGGTHFSLFLHTNTTVQAYINGSVKVGPTYSLNQWNHYAVVVSGNSLRLFLNGVSWGIDINVSGVSFGGNTAYSNYIGTYYDINQRITGYMSEIRITKGTSLGWFNGFTPASSPTSIISSDYAQLQPGVDYDALKTHQTGSGTLRVVKKTSGTNDLLIDYL